MESWMVLCLLALVVAELLCCFWNIFFQWYQRKRECEALHFLNELQQCTDPNLIDPVTIDNLEERGDIIL